METLVHRPSLGMLSPQNQKKRGRPVAAGVAAESRTSDLPDTKRRRRRRLPVPVPCCPPHPGFLCGVCFNCGQHVKDGEEELDNDGEGGALVAFEYLQSGLTLSCGYQDAIRREYTSQLLDRQRLMLVLDLDHTLLHSLVHPDGSDTPFDMRSVSAPADELFELNLESAQVITKLRPYARQFLSALNSMYDMYIYTNGSRGYALQAAVLLDPYDIFFKGKVISREDSTETGKKALDLLLCLPEAIVIVDDKETVWRRGQDRENLINVKRYEFPGFSSLDGNAGRRGKADQDTALLGVLDALKRIHFEFFSTRDGHRGSPIGMDQQQKHGEETNSGDVRKVMRNIQSDILSGCRIGFCGIITVGAKVEEVPIWKIAQRLGASCCMHLDKNVTHVLVKDRGTLQARWAVKNNKHVVSTKWLEEAYRIWMRPVEAKFSPPPSPLL